MSFELNLQKFDVSKMDKHSIVGIIGKRNVGKSVLVKDLLHHINIKNGIDLLQRDDIYDFMEKQRFNKNDAYFIGDNIIDTKDGIIKLIFMVGRHHRLFSIFTMQYPLQIPPDLRAQFDYVFIYRDNHVSNRKLLYENYADIFPTFELFCYAMDKYTENYECLVFDFTSKSNKLEEQVFWYKADMH